MRPKKAGDEGHPENMLKVVYDHGKLIEWEPFDQVRARVASSWKKMAADKKRNVISSELCDEILYVSAKIRAQAPPVLDESAS